MIITEEKKQNYISDVYEEMRHRGIDKDDISKVINKTGFMDAINEYPEEQMHYSIADAVDEILLVAATH